MNPPHRISDSILGKHPVYTHISIQSKLTPEARFQRNTATLLVHVYSGFLVYVSNAIQTGAWEYEHGAHWKHFIICSQCVEDVEG